MGQSRNSYLARFNSGIVPEQSRNQDKVRIYCFHCGKEESQIILDFFIIFIFSFHHFMIGTVKLLDESDGCSQRFF